MNNFLKTNHGVDVMPLLLAIRRRPELWREDTYLRDYPQGPFGEVETIMLRFPVKTVHETEAELADHLSRYDQHESIDYPPYKLLTEARPLVMSLMSYVGGERLGRVMINKIAPGGRVFPHADTPVHANYWDCFHVVLESQPGVEFRYGDEHVYMEPGSVWWFQNAIGHVIVGKIHRHAHINTISKGRVVVATEFGTRELSAPITFTSEPGVKRAVVAQEDTIWTTYHPTTETDLAKIEKLVIASSFEDYDQGRLP